MSVSVELVDPHSIHPTFGRFIAGRDASLFHTIQHVQPSVLFTLFRSWGWTEKVWTDPMAFMNTSCCRWETTHSSIVVERWPLGKYCLSCGSAISNSRMPVSWVSFSDTISLCGFVSFLSGRLIFCSLLRGLGSVRHSGRVDRTHSRILWYLRVGNLMSWRVDALSLGRMFTVVPSLLMCAGIGLAVSRWNTRIGKAKR